MRLGLTGVTLDQRCSQMWRITRLLPLVIPLVHKPPRLPKLKALREAQTELPDCKLRGQLQLDRDHHCRPAHRL